MEEWNAKTQTADLPFNTMPKHEQRIPFTTY